MRLIDIAHVRAGDKGNTSQISVIAFDAGSFQMLARQVTVERFEAHLLGLPHQRIVRYELPSLGALNFVIEGALRGGVTRSLALDAHGKTIAAQLLDLELSP